MAAVSEDAAGRRHDAGGGGGTAARIARNVAFLAGGQLVTWSLTLIWTIFVPRNLGPRGIGELTVAYAVTGVVAVVVSLGIPTLLVKDIARDRDRAGRLVGTALALRVTLVAPAVAVVAAYVFLTHMDGEQSTVMWVATAVMVVSFFSTPFLYAIQAFERMEFMAAGDVLNKAAVSFVGVVLVFFGFRAVGLISLALVMAIIVLCLNIFWCRRLFKIEWNFDVANLRQMVVASLPYWSTGLALTFYMWIDSVMLSFMSSTVVVGWYAVPTRIFSTLLFLPAILGTAMLPRLSAAFHERAEALPEVAKPSLELTIVLSLPISVGAALVSQKLIIDFFGYGFVDSIWVMVILAASVAPTYFNIIANQVLVATNRQVAWTKVMVGAAILNPVINVFLIRYFQQHYGNGAIGAAISLLATEVGMAVAGFVLLPRLLDRWSLFRIARTVVACGGMAAAVLAVSSRGLIVESATGMIVFMILAFGLRIIRADELRLMRRAGARMVSRNDSRRYRRQYRGWDDVTARPSSSLR